MADDQRLSWRCASRAFVRASCLARGTAAAASLVFTACAVAITSCRTNTPVYTSVVFMICRYIIVALDVR